MAQSAVQGLAAEAVQLLPSVVWSGGIAAIVSLMGLVFQSWLSGRRQREQLQHDQEQRRLERDLSLRRQTYFEAIEASGRLAQYLAELSSMASSHTELTQKFDGSIGAFRKVDLVGELDTIKAFMDVASAFLRGCHEAMEVRIRAKYLGDAVSAVEARLKSAQESRLAILQRRSEALPGVSLVAAVNVDDFAQNEANFYQAEEARLVERLTDLKASLTSAQIELMVTCSRANLRLKRLVGYAAEAARRELGKNVASSKYRQLLDQYLSEHEALSQSWFQKVAELQVERDNSLHSLDRAGMMHQVDRSEPLRPAPAESPDATATAVAADA